ncbi:hypothetical protein HDU91_003984, partial [Kappamyces sp. JEL0680]
ACKQENKWMDETRFVIEGNEFADASKFWKQEFISGGKKPFSGWTVMLQIDKARRSGFERLVLAGGGTTVDDIVQLQVIAGG